MALNQSSEIAALRGARACILLRGNTECVEIGNYMIVAMKTYL